ncbi:MAG: SCP2 sterol-binding domain-containing protein [Bernardetiaceae bacterium]
MSLTLFTEKVAELASQNPDFQSKVKFKTEQGVVLLDATSSPATVSNDAEAEADCEIGLKLEDGLKMMDKKLSATTAFMVGKLKISGDMGVAMKVAKIIG